MKGVLTTQNLRMIIDNSYILGYKDGMTAPEGKVFLPIINIPMMSDEWWNELARQNALERSVAV